MYRLTLLGCLAACGRIDFESATTTSDGGGDGDGAMADAFAPTGPLGPRWIAKFSDDGRSSVAGTRGDVVVAARFSTGTFAADPNINLTGSGFISTAFVHYDATGTAMYSTVLDAEGFCDMRDIRMRDDVVYLAGFTEGSQAIPAFGACSVATNRQDPIVIQIDAQRAQSVVAHWSASGANAQAWRLSLMPDATVTVSGIYGGDLQIGTDTLPTAIIDPSFWMARSQLANPSLASWAIGYTAGTTLFGGAVDTSGEDVCTLGSYNGNVTLFGQALPYAGGTDSWVARLDGTGSPRWIRGFGSTGDEPQDGLGNIIAAEDGGCVVGTSTGGNLMLDGTTYLQSAGSGLLVRFAGDGSIAWVRQYPSEPFITVVGERLIAAYSNNDDVNIVEVDRTGTADTPLGVVGGSGVQYVFDIVRVAPDAVAITVTNQGALTFGATSFDTGATQMRAVGVLGI